jgi:hypothetical protein
MAKGGKRPGAGRKPDPTKDIRLGAITALKILRELEHEKALVKIFKTCYDPRLKVHIIMRLREWAYDKPAQPLRVGNEAGKNGKPIPFNVNVDSARDKLIAALLS